MRQSNGSTHCAWRETPFFDDRERAALGWIEAVTLVAQTHVPDHVYEEAKKHFTKQEIVDLTYLAAIINAWNRLAIALRALPGHYRATKDARVAASRGLQSRAEDGVRNA